MCKWEDIQTKTELKFIVDVLIEKIKNSNIERIFSFDDAIPRKNIDIIEHTTLENPLYILFDNKCCLVMEFINYSSINLDYRKITSDEIKQSIRNISNKNIDYLIDYLNNYHEIYGWNFDENLNRIEDSFKIKTITEIKGNYDRINDIQIEGFSDSYEKWISDGKVSSIITIPAGGDYFKSITFMLNNGIEISVCPQPTEMDGYYDLINKDTYNIIKYSNKEI